MLLVAGIFGMGLTTKQFFPDSNRAEFLVDLWLPEGASLAATRREAEKLEKWLAADPDAETFVAYIGNGSPRYFLSLDKQLYRTNYAQFVVLTKDLEARQRLLGRLRPALDSQFPGVRTRAYPNPLGHRWPFRCSSASRGRTSPNSSGSVQTCWTWSAPTPTPTVRT